MLLPLIALIRYQVVPDLAPGQFVLQCDPPTVATTVSFALVARRVLTAADVDVAGSDVDAGAGRDHRDRVAGGSWQASPSAIAGPPSANRQAK